MLHSHLTALNAVSLILTTFAAQGLAGEELLAASDYRETRRWRRSMSSSAWYRSRSSATIF